MNKRLLVGLFALAFFSIQQAAAQLDDERRNVAIGVSGGINLNSVSFHPSIEQQLFIAPSAGFTVRYISEKYFKMLCGIQAEVNYSGRGWKEKPHEETGEYYSRSLNYVEVPLLAHLAFGKDSYTKGLRFFVNMGPSFGFLIHEKEHWTAGFNPNSQPEINQNTYGKKVEKKVEYGILGGAGLELSTKVGHFLLEGRYYFGLGNIYGDTKKDVFGRSAGNYIGIRLSYLVDLLR
ncbi:MAG: porin family protein [Phocaeicola sp.]